MSLKKAFIKPVPRATGLPIEIQRENPVPYTPGFKEGTTSVIKGITFEEQKKLLPNLIGVSDSSPDYQNKVDEFYYEFTFAIPFDGMFIEVGINEDGSPVNIREYILGKLMTEDRRVAKKEEDIENSHFFDYTLVYQDEENKKEIKKYEKQKEADIEFVKLISSVENKSKIKHLAVVNKDFFKLTVFAINELTEPQRELKLKEFVNTDPVLFLKQIKNENLKYLSFIHSALDIGMYSQAGESIYFEDSQIGVSIDNVAEVLKSDSAMFAKHQEIYKIKKNVNVY